MKDSISFEELMSRKVNPAPFLLVKGLAWLLALPILVVHAVLNVFKGDDEK